MLSSTYYCWKCNLPMSPHFRPLVGEPVGRLIGRFWLVVGWTVYHYFLKGRERICTLYPLANVHEQNEGQALYSMNCTSIQDITAEGANVSKLYKAHFDQWIIWYYYNMNDNNNNKHVKCYDNDIIINYYLLISITKQLPLLVVEVNVRKKSYTSNNSDNRE